MLTPPSSIHFKTPSKAEHWSNSISPTKPAILLFKTPVWGFYNCTLTWELWFFWSKLQLHWVLSECCTRSAEESAWLNFPNLCSQCPSISFLIIHTSLNCSITNSEGRNISLPIGQNRTAIMVVPMHVSPGICTPCIIYEPSQTTLIPACTETHLTRHTQEGSGGWKETGAAGGQRTYFVVPLCM